MKIDISIKKQIYFWSMSFVKRIKYVLAPLVLILLYISFIFLLPQLLHVDTVSLGINQHCGFYTDQNELITPCKCLGVWTKGKLLVKNLDDDLAYCTGIMGIVFLH